MIALVVQYQIIYPNLHLPYLKTGHRIRSDETKDKNANSSRQNTTKKTKDWVCVVRPLFICCVFVLFCLTSFCVLCPILTFSYEYILISNPLHEVYF